jgi:DNA polymerase III subunit epsilon
VTAQGAPRRRFVRGALVVLAAAAAGFVWPIARGGDAASLWTGLAFSLALGAGALALLWRWTGAAVARESEALAAAAALLRDAGAAEAIDARRYPALGAAAGAVSALGKALIGARSETERAVAAATGEAHAIRRRLEAVLRDLSEGVIVCTLDHRIVLYNRAAQIALGGSGELGLDRPLFKLLAGEPVLHALDLAQARAADPAHEDAGPDPDPTVPFVAATGDGQGLLRGRLGLVQGADGRPDGYVLSFGEATQELAALTKRDALLLAADQELRRPMANLRAAVETLAHFPDMAAAERAGFERVIADESATLSAAIDRIGAEYREIAAGFWPMAEMHSADLHRLVARRLEAPPAVPLTMVGLPVWLSADSYGLVAALTALARWTAAETGAATLDFEGRVGDRRIYVDLVWEGAPLPAATVESWLDRPVGADGSGLTLRAVLDRHHAVLWSQAAGRGRALLRLPLPAADIGALTAPRRRVAARPEFYDFSLAAEAPAALADRKLRALGYVVFDCETTGLDIERGDALISIGAVRVVGGRIITGESFHRLIDPGRPIPKASTAIHGIDDAAVKGRPPAAIVLRQFKEFAGDSVLVAHNASFDLAFLKRGEADSGVVFDNPALCTLLAAATLEPALGDHSLDGLAERFGVAIAERHDALGDAMATAALFLRLVDLMEARGVETLGQAMHQTRMVMQLRAGLARW